MNQPAIPSPLPIVDTSNPVDLVIGTKTIIEGCREILARVEDDAESFRAPETAAALRQAQTYIGLALEHWRWMR